MWIRIVVIRCPVAQAKGQQYTKRMLPDFLIPHARMRLDRIIDAVKERERGADLELCSRIIGCIDLATARRHFRRLQKAASAVALLLAKGHATAPHLSENNQELRPLPLFKRLETLYRIEQEKLLRAGKSSVNLPDLRYLLQTALWKPYGKVSTSFPSRSPPRPCYTC